MTIYFDMDGTIADLYAVENWLEKLEASDPSPYKMAKPLLNLSMLARYINKRQKQGLKFGVISWLSKSGNAEYNAMVTMAKLNWLKKHMPSVNWDEIHIVEYGTPKSTCGHGILFDDEERNRDEWGKGAFTPDLIMEILKEIL